MFDRAGYTWPGIVLLPFEFKSYSIAAPYVADINKCIYLSTILQPATELAFYLRARVVIKVEDQKRPIGRHIKTDGFIDR